MVKANAFLSSCQFTRGSNPLYHHEMLLSNPACIHVRVFFSLAGRLSTAASTTSGSLTSCSVDIANIHQLHNIIDYRESIMKHGDDGIKVGVLDEEEYPVAFRNSTSSRDENMKMGSTIINLLEESSEGSCNVNISHRLGGSPITG